MSIGLILGLIVLAIFAALLIVNRVKVIAFVLSSRNEMKKVVFPTRERVLLQTRVVLLSLVVAALFFGGVDFFLGWLMKLIFK